ncbi:MAG: hypothetical protein HYU67_12150 [Flavobacteriia bacterium]|nr:hypothetical protein [Flavobacteriia bacterium]
MHFTKIIYRIGIFISLLILFSDCKKLTEEKYGIKVRLIYPHINKGVSGINYEIIETKEKFSITGDLFQKFESKVVKSGVLSNSTNYQIIEFIGKKRKGKYGYSVNFDFSSLNELDEVYATNIGLGNGAIDHAYCNEANTFDIYVLTTVKNLTIHYKNINFFNETDSFRHKSAILERKIYKERKNEIDFENMNWNNFSYLQGIVDYSKVSESFNAGHWVVKWEATRNGIITTGLDTILIKDDNQTIELEW